MHPYINQVEQDKLPCKLGSPCPPFDIIEKPHCTRCFAILEENDKFCQFCGGTCSFAFGKCDIVQLYFYLNFLLQFTPSTPLSGRADEWEIKRADLHLKSTILGTGNFGNVVLVNTTMS